MNENDKMTETAKLLEAARISRRTLLGTAAKTGAALAAGIFAPAIVGRAPVTSAKAAFEGENLIAVSWSGNYEGVFREQIIGPFNEKYKTKAETVGGWDQMVPQIKAAPADNPPFDVTVAEEYVSSSGLAEKLYEKADPAKMPNLAGVYDWFRNTRPDHAKDYGVPFGGGTNLVIADAGLKLPLDSWKVLWDDRVAGKGTADSAGWQWTLSIPAIISTASPGLDEMYDWPNGAEPLFQQLETMKIKKWYKDGAEQANLLNQDEASVGMSYSSDAFTFMQQTPGKWTVGFPKEGVAAWTDYYFKVRGTKHSDLADLFLDYLVSKEAQDRFLANSLIYMSRKDVAVPPQWGDSYPKSNDDFSRMFNLITIQGWDKIGLNYDAMTDRMKKVVAKTTG